MRYLDIIIIFFFVLSLISCIKPAKRVIYLIPKGFEGKVYLIFNQQDGVPPIEEGQSLLFRIRENGVLKTQRAPTKGRVTQRYFYEDSNGNRTELPYYDGVDLQARRIDSSQIFSYFNEWAIAPDNKIKGEIKRYETFYIASLKSLDSIANSVEYLFNKPVDE